MELQPINHRQLSGYSVSQTSIPIQQGDPGNLVVNPMDLHSDSKLLDALSPADKYRYGNPVVANALASATNDVRQLPPIPDHLQTALIQWIQQPMIISWEGTGKFSELTYSIEITLKELLRLEKIPAFLYGSSFHKLVLSDRGYLTCFLLEQGLTSEECEQLLNDLLTEPLISNPHDFDIKRFRQIISDEPSALIIEKLCSKLPPRLQHIQPDDQLVIDFLTSCNRGRPLGKNENQCLSKFLIRETAFDKYSSCFNSSVGAFYILRLRTDVTPEYVRSTWPTNKRPLEIVDIQTINTPQLFEHDLTLSLDSLLEGRVSKDLRPEGIGGRKGLISLLLRCRNLSSGVTAHHSHWQRLLINTTFGCRSLVESEINNLNHLALSQDISYVLYDTLYRGLEGDLSAATALMINAYTLLQDSLSIDQLNAAIVNALELLKTPPKRKTSPSDTTTVTDLVQRQPPELKKFMEAIAKGAFSPTEVVSTLQAASYVLLNSDSRIASLMECGDNWCISLSVGCYKLLLPAKPINSAKQVPHNLFSDISIDTSCHNTLHKFLINKGLTYLHLIKLSESTSNEKLKLNLLILALQLNPELFFVDENRLLGLPACSEVIDTLEMALPLTRFRDLLAVGISESSNLASLRKVLSKPIVNKKEAWQRGWIRTFLNSPNELHRSIATKLWRQCYQNNAEWEFFSNELVKSLASNSFWMAVSCFQFINKQSEIPFKQFAEFCQLIPDDMSEFDQMALDSLQKIALSYKNVSLSKGQRKRLGSHLTRLIGNSDHPTTTTLRVIHGLLRNKVLTNTQSVSDLWIKVIYRSLETGLLDALQSWETVKPYGITNKENLTSFCDAVIEQLKKRSPPKEEISALYQFLNDNVIEERYREAITPFIADYVRQFIVSDNINTIKSALHKMGPCALRAHVRETIVKWIEAGNQIKAINLTNDYLQLVSRSPDLSLFQDVVHNAVSAETFNSNVFNKAIALLRSNTAKQIFKNDPIQLMHCLAPWLRHTSLMSLQERQLLLEDLLLAWSLGQASPVLKVALAISNEVMQLPAWTEAIHRHMRTVGPTMGNILVTAGRWKEADRLALAIIENDAKAINFLISVAEHQLSTESGKKAFDTVNQASSKLCIPLSSILKQASGLGILLALQLLQEEHLENALACLKDVDDPNNVKEGIVKNIYLKALLGFHTNIAYNTLQYCNMPSAEVIKCHRQIFTVAVSQHSFSFACDLLLAHKKSFNDFDFAIEYVCKVVTGAIQAPCVTLKVKLEMLETYKDLSEETWIFFYSQLKGPDVPLARAVQVLEEASHLTENARISCWMKLAPLLPNAPQAAVAYILEPPLHIFPSFETRADEQVFFYEKLFETAANYCALIEKSQADAVALQWDKFKETLDPLMSQPYAINHNIIISLSLARMMYMSENTELYLRGLCIVEAALKAVNQFVENEFLEDQAEIAWDYYCSAYFADDQAPDQPNLQSLLFVKHLLMDYFTPNRLLDICENLGSHLHSNHPDSITTDVLWRLQGIWDELIELLNDGENVMTDPRPLLVFANHLCSASFASHLGDALSILEKAIKKCDLIGIDQDPDLVEVLEMITTPLLHSATRAPGAKFHDQIQQILSIKSLKALCCDKEYAEVIDSLHGCKLWSVMNYSVHQLKPIFDELMGSLNLVLSHVPVDKSRITSVFFSMMLYLNEEPKNRAVAMELLDSFFNHAPSHFYRGFKKVSDSTQPAACDVSLSMEWVKRKLRWPLSQQTKITETHRETCASTLLSVMNHLPHLSQEAAPHILDALHVYLESCLLHPIKHANKDFTPINLYDLAIKRKIIDSANPDHALYRFLAYQQDIKNWSAETQVNVYKQAIDHLLQWKGKDKITMAFKWLRQMLPLSNSIDAACFIPILDNLIDGLPMDWSAIDEQSSVMSSIYETMHSLKLPLQQKTQYHNQFVRILKNAWIDFEAKECKIIGSVGSTGDLVSLNILQNTAKTLICTGIKTGCYLDRMSQAIDDLIAFMPITRMACTIYNKNEHVFITSILMNLDKYPDLHRHRAVAMNEWIRLISELNVAIAKNYLLNAIKENWYKNHADLLREAYNYLQPK